VLLSEPSVLLPERRVEIRVVVDLAGAAGPGVEPLRRFTVSHQGVRVEQVTSFHREGQPALAVAKLHGLDESLVVEVVERFARKIRVAFRHDPKGADGGQRPAVFAVQLVDSVAVNDQFAHVTARQVEIKHQRVPWIATVPVARIVHSRLFVTAFARFVFARITPSSIGHGFPPVLQCCCFSVVREDALAVPASVVQGSAEAPVRFRRGDQRLAVWNLNSGRLARRR